MSHGSTTSTILIVDHNPAALSMKRRLLSRQSYRIIEAENGTDALMLAAAELPDLVLLDTNLPDIGSFDACRQLKTQSATKFMKILQTSTARMNASARPKNLEVGADAYLVEPIEDEELIGTTRALLKLAQQERDNIRLAERLSRAERQLSAATEAAHCAIWDWDIAADRVEWSSRIERLTGLSPGSFSGKMQAFIDVLHSDDRSRVRQKLEQAMAGHAIDYADEYRVRHPNGDVHHLHADGRFHYDGEGKAVRMTGLVQDITERKRAEVALRESEERFAKAFRTSPHPIGITEAATGRCIEVNDACLQLFGFSREEVIGSTTLMLGIWPNQQDRDRLVGRLKAGEPVRNLELRFKTKSGDFRHILVSSDLVELNGTLCLITVGNDITNRKQAEEQLRESEGRFRKMAEAVPSFLFETDADGWNTWTSEGWCRFTGQTLEQVAGHGWAEALHPEDRKANIDQWLQCMKNGETFEAQQRLRRTDGTYAWVIARALPVRDDQGRVRRWVGSVTDVDAIMRAEEQLRENHRFISEMTSVLPGVLYIFDLQEQRNIYVNRHIGAVLGYGAEEVHVLGTNFIPTILHPGDAIRLLQHYESFKELEDGVTVQVEYRFRHRDGSYRWYLSRDVAWQRSVDGHVRQILGMATDITELKQAEEALREGELRFRALVERIGDVFWIANPTDGQILYASEAFEDIWGRDLQQLYGRCETWLEAIHEEDRERVKNTFFANIYAGQYDSEYRVVRPDGTIRWIRDHGKPLGIGKLVAGVAEDITERRQAEAALRESEARFRNVFEHAGTGIAIAELEGSFVQCNPAYCAMLGYTEDELRCLRFPELIHPEDRAGNVAGLERLIAGELPYFEVENRYVDKNGEPVWVHKFVSQLRNHAGESKYLVALVTNVTDRRKAEQELRKAQAHLQRWTIELEQAVNEKTVELRQSQDRLRALASELNLAEQRERKRLATELHDHLQQTLVLGRLTMGQGKRLAVAVPACLEVMKKADDIFSEALTYTRTLVAELSPPVLRDQGLAAGLKWLSRYMQKYGLAVTVTVPEAVELNVPEDQAVLLFQSVRELLMNAWKYAGTGKAAVVMTHTGDRVRITVSDKGAGFDLAAAAAKPTGGGLSSKFGLFSIEERMRSLGGSFELHSAPGQGTTATLSLSLAGTGDERVVESPQKQQSGAWSVVRDAQEGAGSSSLGAPPTTRHPSPIRVLLVDDHAMVRQGLRAMLESYEDMDVVGEAVDGQDAIRLAEQLRPGIVVMDINMPKMNGIEATRELTTRYPDVTVIGLSVNAGDDNHDAMTKAGAVRLMTKESAVEELYGAIQEVIPRERVTD